MAVVGDWVIRLITERGATWGEFWTGLERGLSMSKCRQCAVMDSQCRAYPTCRRGGKPVMFIERVR